MALVEIPDFWILYNSDGMPVGSQVSILMSGEMIAGSESQAWVEYFPRARERASKQKAGWVIVGISRDEFSADLMKRKRETVANDV